MLGWCRRYHPNECDQKCQGYLKMDFGRNQREKLIMKKRKKLKFEKIKMIFWIHIPFLNRSIGSILVLTLLAFFPRDGLAHLPGWWEGCGHRLMLGLLLPGFETIMKKPARIKIHFHSLLPKNKNVIKREGRGRSFGGHGYNFAAHFIRNFRATTCKQCEMSWASALTFCLSSQWLQWRRKKPLWAWNTSNKDRI